MHRVFKKELQAEAYTALNMVEYLYKEAMVIGPDFKPKEQEINSLIVCYLDEFFKS